MLSTKTIGLIGAGNMAETLISGLIASKLSHPDRLACSDIRKSRLDELAERYGVQATTDNKSVIKGADIIIFAVKPQIIGEVLKETADSLDLSKLIISIAAGVPMAAIEKVLGKGLRLIRAMPNVCVAAREGATAIIASADARSEDVDLARSVFQSVGRCIIVKDDRAMDAVTGLSGSGPAYIFMILDALADAGVKMGLTRKDASVLAAQTTLGAAKMLLETGLNPGQLKDMVTSPGGTTIAGLHALEKGSLRATLINGVEAATLRSKELGDIMTRQISGK
jgi:pyrroline-5-carboxylate reductase